MIEYALVIFLFVLALFVLAVRHYGRAWLKTREGKGVMFGLIVAPLVALLLGLIGGCASTSLEVFAGLEQTKNQSPQCDEGGASDRLTSNLGVQTRSVISEDGKTFLNVGYRHHSCAITADRESYDAFFIETSRQLHTW